MSSTEPREHRQIYNAVLKQKILSTGNIRSTEPQDIESTRSTYSRNTASDLKVLALLGPSRSVLCRPMALRIVDTMHRRSKYAM